MNITVMLTCVGGELAPQMLLDLKLRSRHSIKVIGVDTDPLAIGRNFCDEFVIVPHGSDPSYIETIVSISKKHSVNLIVPTSDEEAIAISSSRKVFDEEGVKLACTHISTLEVLTNKAKTYNKLKEYGVHVPQWLQVDNINDLIQAVKSMYAELGEVVVKPAQGRGGRGVYIVTNSISGVNKYKDRREIHSDIETFLEDYINTLSNSFPVIIMERLVEPVYDLDLLAWKGEPIRVVPRRRIDSAVPNFGHTIVNDQSLIDLGESLIKLFKLSWLYDCDIMYDKDEKPCVLEINPRESGSVAVSVAAGIPLLDDLISLAIGEQVPKVALPNGVTIVPYTSLFSV